MKIIISLKDLIMQPAISLGRVEKPLLRHTYKTEDHSSDFLKRLGVRCMPCLVLALAVLA